MGLFHADLDEDFLLQMYKKAKKNFNSCILDKNNDYLLEELKTPLENVELRNCSEQFKFNLLEVKDFTIETTIQLFIENEIIGKYSYIESSQGFFIDDVLVFY
jgi:hypothetical protein